jgi:hypothetical protein
MAAALLDLQHYCPALLAAAADAALQQGSTANAAQSGSQPEQKQQQLAGNDATSSSSSSLAPEEVVSLLLALGFFRLPAPDFVESALEVSGRGRRGLGQGNCRGVGVSAGRRVLIVQQGVWQLCWTLAARASAHDNQYSQHLPMNCTLPCCASRCRRLLTTLRCCWSWSRCSWHGCGRRCCC